MQKYSHGLKEKSGKFSGKEMHWGDQKQTSIEEKEEAWRAHTCSIPCCFSD